MTYHPDRSEQETELYARKLGVGALNNHSAVVLHADSDTNHAKVHDHQRPDSPIDDDLEEILEGPDTAMVHPRQVFIMNSGILPGQSRSALRDPPAPTISISHFPWRQWSIWKPPQ